MHEADAKNPVSPQSRRLSARDAMITIVVVALVLLLSQGAAVRQAGQAEQPGIERSLLLALGHPAGWVSDQLPFADVTADATDFLDPDADLADVKPVSPQGGGLITPDAFDPAAIGARARPAGKLEKLLVTGDSMVIPMDGQLARRLADRGVKVLRQPKVGTGISKLDLLDWPQESARQAASEKPDAVVVMIGVNEGFDLQDPRGATLRCCDARWAAAYANRARAMMAAWRQGGRARVYWLLVPAMREAARNRIGRVTNAAFRVAASPFGAQVRLLDIGRIITPGFRYRDSMPLGGRKTLVRDPDGKHLNEEGADIAADLVISALERDFGTG